MALNRIHQLLTRTTTYSEQFSSPNTPRGLPNILQTAYSFRSRESHRPWTAESRGKYNRVAMPVSRGLDASTGLVRPQTVKYSSNEQENSEIDGVSTFEQNADEEPVKIDASTQTEDEYFVTTATLTELPTLFPGHKLLGDQGSGLNELQNVDTHSQIGSQCSQQSIPRSSQSTRRLMTLFNGFNKTDVLKRFHEDFPEKTADLREYSTHEGKRHYIHGSHSYYYH